MRTLASRVVVVGPTFAVGAALSALAAFGGATKLGWSLGDTLTVWASPLAGPFAGLWATSTWSPAEAFAWAVPFGLLVAAHPLRRGWYTGMLTVLGVSLWVLAGLVFTFDGV